MVTVKKIFTILFLVAVLPLTAFGQFDSYKRTYASQVVLGEGWKLAVRCVNNDQTTSRVVVFQPYFFENVDGKSVRYKGDLKYTSEDDSGLRYPDAIPAHAGRATTLPAGQSYSAQIEKLSPGMVIGWAEIIQSSPITEYVTCTVVVQFYENGVFKTEASVLPSASAQVHNFPVLISSKEGQNVGFAVANPNKVPVMVTYTITKSGSALNGRTISFVLEPEGHHASFLTERFPDILTERNLVEQGVVGMSLSISAKDLNGKDVLVPSLAFNTRDKNGFTMTTVSASSK